MIDLGALSGRVTGFCWGCSASSSSKALNASGQVVGETHTWHDEHPVNDHAFSWTAAGGMIDLGTLGGSSSVARAVNARGQVVGDATTPEGWTHTALWPVIAQRFDPSPMRICAQVYRRRRTSVPFLRCSRRRVWRQTTPGAVI
jgi:probable HAF family extracellular repeat protein